MDWMDLFYTMSISPKKQEALLKSTFYLLQGRASLSLKARTIAVTFSGMINRSTGIGQDGAFDTDSLAEAFGLDGFIGSIDELVLKGGAACVDDKDFHFLYLV